MTMLPGLIGSFTFDRRRLLQSVGPVLLGLGGVAIAAIRSSATNEPARANRFSSRSVSRVFAPIPLHRHPPRLQNLRCLSDVCGCAKIERCGA